MEINLELFERISQAPYLTINQVSFYLVRTKKKQNEMFTLAIYEGEPDLSLITAHSQIQGYSQGIMKIRGFKNMTSKDDFGFHIQRYSLLFEEISSTLYCLLLNSRQFVISLLNDLVEIVAELQDKELAIKYINPEDIVYTKNKKFKIINVREAFNYIGCDSTVAQKVEEKNYHYMDQLILEAILNGNSAIMQNCYKSSIFSIGLIVLEFYNQEFSNVRHDPYELEKIICSFEQDFGKQYGTYIRKMLEQDRNKRYNCIDAKQNLPELRPPVLRHYQTENQLVRNFPDTYIFKDQDFANQFQKSDNIKRSSLKISSEIRKSIKEWNGNQIQDLQMLQSEFEYYPGHIDEVEQSSFDSATSYKVSQKALQGILNHLQYLPFIEFTELKQFQVLNDQRSILKCQVQGIDKTVIKFSTIPNIYILQIIFNIQSIEQLKIKGICNFECFSVKECIEKKNLDFCSDLYLITRTFKGSLHKLKDKLNDKQIMDIIKQMISTLGQMNKHNFVHGVLTPKSIMLTEKYEISLIHYGLSDIMTEKDIIGEVAPYIPPEKLLDNEYQQTSDIWNLGLIIYELLFKETITAEQIQQWGMADKDKKGNLSFKKNKSIPQSELLKQMTEFNHSKRITFSELEMKADQNFKIEPYMLTQQKMPIKLGTSQKSISQAFDLSQTDRFQKERQMIKQKNQN